MPVSSASVQAILKELYPEGRPEEMLYKPSRFLQTIKKDPNFAGQHVKAPLEFEGHMGRSADFARAQANKAQEEQRVAFEIDVVEDYAVYTVSELDMRRTRNDEGAFVRLLESRVNSAMYTIERGYSHAIWRNGGGARGRLTATSTVASPTITLTDTNDMRFFGKGMVVQASDTDGTSGALRSAGARATIGSLNRSEGTLTVESGPNWDDNIAAIAASDYLFMDGDFGARLSGVEAWIPPTAPGGADDFFGVNRSVDTDRLAGLRDNLSSLQIEEAFVEAVRQVGDAGGMPDQVWCSSRIYTALGNALRGQFTPSTIEAYENPSVGVKTMRVNAAGHEVDIAFDPDCPDGLLYVMTSDTWKLWSAGDWYSIYDGDGVVALREASSAGVEGRIYGFPQLECTNPGMNGRFDVAA